MSDQEILDMIVGIKNDAEAETGGIALPEEKNDGSGAYDSKAEEIDASRQATSSAEEE